MDGVDKLKTMQGFMDVEVTGVRPGMLMETQHQPGSAEKRGTCSLPDKTAQQNPEGQCERLRSFPIQMAALPNGQRIPLLKTALTTACERNCNYCAFRTGRDFRRQTFLPDEMAKTFMQLYRAGMVEGLFISSGIAGGGVTTQDRLLDTAEILRKNWSFEGYIHLKIMPGAEKAQVERGMQLADRVSVNLEAPTRERLAKLAPEKQFFDELLEPLKWVEEIRQTHPPSWGWKNRMPSSTTQFVVGAIDETDMELLQITAYLHAILKLSRIYFSGFSPVSGTPFEDRIGVDPQREVRLYQAAFLLRDYGFDYEELNFNGTGNLPLDRDPKLAWANEHLLHEPVEINRADYHQLVRIPGIGPVNAKRILEKRTQGMLRHIGELRASGVYITRAAPYILLNGTRPPQQMALPLSF